MLNQAQVEHWPGRSMIDRDGAVIGAIKDVFADAEGRPAWATVRSGGRLSRRVRFVPIADADQVAAGIVVPFTAALVVGAPDADRHGNLTGAERRALHAHYGLNEDATLRAAVRPPVRGSSAPTQRTPASADGTTSPTGGRGAETGREDGSAAGDPAPRPPADAPTDDLTGRRTADGTDHPRASDGDGPPARDGDRPAADEPTDRPRKVSGVDPSRDRAPERDHGRTGAGGDGPPPDAFPNPIRSTGPGDLDDLPTFDPDSPAVGDPTDPRFDPPKGSRRPGGGPGPPAIAGPPEDPFTDDGSGPPEDEHGPLAAAGPAEDPLLSDDPPPWEPEAPAGGPAGPGPGAPTDRVVGDPSDPRGGDPGDDPVFPPDVPDFPEFPDGPSDGPDEPV